MATIEKRKSGDGFVYRARVRVKGAEPRTATFPNKTLATFVVSLDKRDGKDIQTVYYDCRK